VCALCVHCVVCDMCVCVCARAQGSGGGRSSRYLQSKAQQEEKEKEEKEKKKVCLSVCCMCLRVCANCWVQRKGAEDADEVEDAPLVNPKAQQEEKEEKEKKKVCLSVCCMCFRVCANCWVQRKGAEGAAAESPKKSPKKPKA
jgi:hypothetical protein